MQQSARGISQIWLELLLFDDQFGYISKVGKKIKKKKKTPGAITISKEWNKSQRS
jgi:hypothetical protein